LALDRASGDEVNEVLENRAQNEKDQTDDEAHGEDHQTQAVRLVFGGPSDLLHLSPDLGEKALKPTF
jgi:hypothetical protein